MITTFAIFLILFTVIDITGWYLVIKWLREGSFHIIHMLTPILVLLIITIALICGFLSLL